MGHGESTGQLPLGVTLFDLDAGAGDCLNVAAENPCPLVISNLINSEQRDVFGDFALEMAHRWGNCMTVYGTPGLVRCCVWTWVTALLHCLICPCPPSSPVSSSLCDSLASQALPRPLTVVINFLRTSVCQYPNSFRTYFSSLILIFFP